MSLVFFLVLFFALIFWPGYFLSRYFRFSEQSSGFDKIILTLTIGLFFNFLLCFGAILVGLTIKALLVLFITINVIFLLRFIKETTLPKLDVRVIFKNLLKSVAANPLEFLFCLFVPVLLLVIAAHGPDFTDEINFHLAIMQKAISGLPLTAHNLALVNSASLHPAYAFPVWHVFLSVFVLLTNSDIFTIWSYSLIPLTLMCLALIYWLSQKIIPLNEGRIFTLLLFVLFILQTGSGYLFSRLPLPAVFCQIILLPLALGFLIELFLKDKIGWPDIMMVLLSILFLGLIHIPHLVYFSLIFIVMSILLIKDKPQRVLKLWGAALIFALGAIGLALSASIPVLEIFKGNNTLVMENLPFSMVMSIKNFGAYIVAGLTIAIAFWRRKSLVLPVALFGLILLFKITAVKIILTKMFGFILAYRFEDDLAWLWLIYGTAVAMVILGLSKMNIIKQFKHRHLALTAAAILIAVFLFKGTIISSIKDVSVVAIKQSLSAQKIKNNIAFVGGADAINFIKKNIPPKSIFLTDEWGTNSLPLFVDQFLVTYPRNAKDEKYQKIFTGELSSEQIIALVHQSKAEYILTAIPIYKPIFDNNPDFQKIYDLATGAAIYKFIN